MEKLLLFNNIEIYTAITAGFLFIIQLLYYLLCYAKPLRAQKIAQKQCTSSSGLYPSVSVIVYAKNESDNLKQYLPLILEQVYPNYEVIVVNDGSTDESDTILKSFELKYKHLYHTYIPEEVKYLSRKKLALTVGIKAAKHDILLFTEANCRPLSPKWIEMMAKNFTPGTDIVLGFGAYEKEKGFWHRLASYDNLISGLQYLSSALRKHPYMGSGKNLAYRKELFFQHKGFYKSLNLHAGEDDLFINEIANKHNTHVELSPESITMQAPFERFKVWKEMKVSRAATTKHNKGWALGFYKIRAFMYALFALSVLACITVGIIGNPTLIVIGALLYLLYFLTQALVIHKSGKALQQQTPTIWLPVLSSALPVFNLYVRIYRVFRGKNDYTFRLISK